MIRRETFWEVPMPEDGVLLGVKEVDGEMVASVEIDGEIIGLIMRKVDRIISTENAEEF